MRSIALIGMLAAASPGCANNGATEQAGSDQAAAEIDGQVRAASGESAATIASRAIGIAGEHLGVAVDQLEIARVDAVDWPDSSLGCPQPGMSYLQVITPGHKVLVRYGDQLVPVHMANGSGFVCESSRADLKELKPRIHRLRPEQLGELAVADLAQRLRVAREDIRILSTQSAQWPDSSLGCPFPGGEYEEATTWGFIILLAHGSTRYAYHSDQLRVIPCPPVASE